VELRIDYNINACGIHLMLLLVKLQHPTVVFWIRAITVNGFKGEDICAPFTVNEI
jgi:hypothetical protein